MSVGAKVHSIEVNYNEGGKTELSGGCSCCILPAGRPISAIYYLLYNVFNTFFIDILQYLHLFLYTIWDRVLPDW